MALSSLHNLDHYQEASDPTEGCSLQRNEVLIQDIRNIQINQGPLQRITDAGKIGISSAAQSDIEIEVQGIPNPKRVKAIIDKCRAA